MTQATRYAPAIAQGAMTPQTRLAYEKARENFFFHKTLDLLDSLGYDSDDLLDLPFNTLLA